MSVSSHEQNLAGYGFRQVQGQCFPPFTVSELEMLDMGPAHLSQPKVSSTHNSRQAARNYQETVEIKLGVSRTRRLLFRNSSTQLVY